MHRPLIASFTVLAYLATGCAGGRPWPAHPTAVASSALSAAGATIATVDVLPLDLQLWAQPEYDVDVDAVRAAAETTVMSAVIAALGARRYAIGATIDWTGAYPGGTALGHDDLLATVGALSHYGAVAAGQPGTLPVPFLPARLGTTTGADATLYVGGWGLLAPPVDDGSDVAGKVMAGLLIITMVAFVALAIAAVAGDHKSSSSDKADKADKGRKGPRHGGGDHGGAGGAPVVSAGRGAAHIGRGDHAAFHIARGMVDAFGRLALDVAAASDWGADPALPRTGEPALYLEMTLVDNHTGLALWHARQRFPASAESPDEVTRAAATVLSLLPARPAGT